MSLIKEKGEKHSFAKGNCQTTNLSTSKDSQIFRITFDYTLSGTSLYVLTTCAFR